MSDPHLHLDECFADAPGHINSTTVRPSRPLVESRLADAMAAITNCTRTTQVDIFATNIPRWAANDERLMRRLAIQLVGGMVGVRRCGLLRIIGGPAALLDVLLDLGAFAPNDDALSFHHPSENLWS